MKGSSGWQQREGSAKRSSHVEFKDVSLCRGIVSVLGPFDFSSLAHSSSRDAAVMLLMHAVKLLSG